MFDLNFNPLANLVWVLIMLTWDHDGVDTLGYRVYAKATTQTAYQCIADVKKAQATVKVDGRRNWEFYVIAYNAAFESRSSNHIVIHRGY